MAAVAATAAIAVRSRPATPFPYRYAIIKLLCFVHSPPAVRPDRGGISMGMTTFAKQYIPTPPARSPSAFPPYASTGKTPAMQGNMPSHIPGARADGDRSPMNDYVLIAFP